MLYAFFQGAVYIYFKLNTNTYLIKYSFGQNNVQNYRKNDSQVSNYEINQCTVGGRGANGQRHNFGGSCKNTTQSLASYGGCNVDGRKIAYYTKNTPRKNCTAHYK